MHRTEIRGSVRLAYPVLTIVALTWITPAATAQWRAKDSEWSSYNADLAGSRYRPLDQINGSNFNKLEVAWRFKTDSIGNRPEYKLEGTPLMVNGVVYATAGSRRAAVALDAVTGELLWVHGEREGERGAASPRALSGRGLAYWSDGKDERIFYVTGGYRLVALDAKTGAVIPSFGKGGIVDLKLDDDQVISAWNDKGEWVPDLVHGEIGLQSAPVVAKDTILIGAAFREGMTPKSMRNNKGFVRGFDVRTGKRLWTFHTIPVKGETGYDTWLNGSAEYTGNTGVWNQITVDEELGLVYLPVESPTGDLYGGHRPGNNLFGESLVCVDLKTGKLKWYFQMVHHPLWDMDASAAPLLMDINVDGRAIKAVALPSKQAFLYVFDRVTGKPVWPIDERPVEKGDVPGEWYAPTQPFPTKPPNYARNGFTPDILIDFTPELRDQALTLVSRYKMGPIFTPPALSKAGGPLSTLNLGGPLGGTNWPGGSFDPETHTVYVYACNSCIYPVGLVPSPKEISDMKYISGNDGQRIQIARGPGEAGGADQPQLQRPPAPPPAAAAGGRGSPAGGGGLSVLGGLTIQGLPLVKPPYGTISAINLDRGDIVWQTPHGDTPDAVRNHLALKGLNIPKTGQSTYNVGTLVTKSLVVAGDATITTTPQHPRGAMLRAYDKKTGQEVGAVYMPAAQSGSPMTYAVNGKQYIVVAVSGGNYSGEYIAYKLPSTY
ncbi:MAG: pyrroloquinoline quinone-dependent dehydrogenase [Acidobacteriia bacterium]|nr:pyrroloquinoline quinone-dependent dehydrogenase [Terriglobia bacterium]